MVKGPSQVHQGVDFATVNFVASMGEITFRIFKGKKAYQRYSWTAVRTEPNRLVMDTTLIFYAEDEIYANSN